MIYTICENRKKYHQPGYQEQQTHKRADVLQHISAAKLDDLDARAAVNVNGVAHISTLKDVEITARVMCWHCGAVGDLTYYEFADMHFCRDTDACGERFRRNAKGRIKEMREQREEIERARFAAAEQALLDFVEGGK